MERNRLKITGRKKSKTMNSIVELIYRRGGEHINQLNEGPDIRLHRGSRTHGTINNSLLLRIDFPTMENSDLLDYIWAVASEPRPDTG